MEIFRQLHSSLANSCEQIFTQAYREFDAEFAAQDEKARKLEREVELANQRQKDAVLRIGALEHEVSCLRSEIGRGDISVADDAYLDNLQRLQERYDPEKVFYSVDNRDSDKPGRDLGRTSEELERIYRALYVEFEAILKISGVLRAQVKRNKGKVAQWQSYFLCDEFTIPVDGSFVNFRRVRRTPDEESQDREYFRRRQQTASHIEGNSHQLQQIEADDGSSRTSQQNGNALRRSRSPSVPQRGYIHPSKQVKREIDDNAPGILPYVQESLPSSTQSDDFNEPHQDNDLSAPTMAETQSLKRKWESSQQGKANHHEYTRVEGFDSGNHISIKSETLSSTPLQSIPRNCDTTYLGTQDLDEIGNTVSTPKKKAFFMSDSKAFPSVSENHDLAQVKGDGKAYTSLESKKKRQRELAAKYDDPEIASIAEDGENENPVALGAGKNVETLMKPPGSHPPPLIRNSSTHRRLEHLLEASSPARPRLTSHKAPKYSGASQHAWADGGVEKESPLNLKNGYRADITPGASMEKPRSVNDSSQPNESKRVRVQGIPSNEMPYRERQIDQLDLSSFKLNPGKNKGLDFAFDEVVRKKTERKCLAGCMRIDCCGGKFRAMARVGGLDLNRALNLEKSESGDEEVHILEEYLGDQKHMLALMTCEDRQDLLIEAKAKLLADKYGRHRYTHDRAHSPPGFWRTHMPSTQELAQDREVAQQIEREKVMERYREAMRPGGLWKFADE